MIMQEGRTSSRPGREAERKLKKRLQQFDLWAASADRSSAGWEGYFPHWLELVREAEEVMAGEHQSDLALSLLGRCWALSEEDETCADWARGHLQDAHIRELVRRLTASAERRTRWQACDVLGDLPALDARTQDALEAGIADEDPYVRRRAFLALLRHNGGVDIQPYFRQMLSDPDSYNRYVAVREALPVGTEALQGLIQAAAQDPAVALLIASAINTRKP